MTADSKEGGWLKLWRCLADSAIWSKPPLYGKVWLWLLFRATHPGNASKRNLPIGTLTTTFSQMAEAVQWEDNRQPKVPDRKTLSRILEWLEIEGMIVIETCPKRFTKISICNWLTYQSPDDELVPSERTSERTTEGTPSKNVKHEKKKEPFVASHDAIRCLKAWEQYRPIIEKHRDTYLQVFDDLHRLDKLPWEGEGGIFAICAFAVKEWEAKHIQAPSKLRKPSKQYPELKTWQVIQGQIQGQRENGNGHPKEPDAIDLLFARVDATRKAPV